MKVKVCTLVLSFLFTILFTASIGQNNNGLQKNQAQSNKQNLSKQKIDLTAPDFSDPTIKQYYQTYTAYIKKVVTTIRDKDEAGTMKLFSEEGKQFENMNKMEKKARATPEEEQKFTTWLMQSFPYQKEIIQSDYYKKFYAAYFKR